MNIYRVTVAPIYYDPHILYVVTVRAEDENQAGALAPTALMHQFHVSGFMCVVTDVELVPDICATAKGNRGVRP